MNQSATFLHSLVLGCCLLFSSNCPAIAQTTNSLPGRTIVKLLPDYLRPRVYALNTGVNTGGIGSLVSLNASNGTFRAEVTLGATPTDMDIDPSGQWLYVIHFGNNTISQINLNSFAVTQTHSFPPPNGSAGDHYNIKCGRNNRLYWLDAAWAPALHIMDFTTGEQVGAYDSGEGFGDLVLSPDKNDLYVWRQYGWSAGSGNSWIWRLSVSEDQVSIQDTSTVGFGRDPLDTPILMSGSGDRVFRNQFVLYTTNLPSVALMFPNSDVIHAISYFGDVAFSPTKAYNARNGEVLYNLPFATTIQAVSGDQRQLFLFKSSPPQIVTVPMNHIAPVPSAGMNPTPADQSTVSLPLNQLAWTWPPGALSFRVYLGTNEAQVAAAATNSSQYRGTVLTASLQLTNALATGRTYYWRVDPVGLGTVTAGTVWRFQTAPIISSPLNVQATTIATFNAASETLSITSGGVPQSWSLTEDIPWLTASATSGTTPSTVTLSFQTASLAAGTYNGSIQISAGASTIDTPVSLEIVPLDLIKMTTDFKRPYIYALQRSPAVGKPASVIFINTDTEQIEKVLPILTDPRDLCVHPREDKLYIVDWLTGFLRVVDLNTQLPLPSLAVHLGLDRVNPGAAGRVIMEDWNQWVGVFAIDTTVTTNGILPQLAYLREGDGETSTDGRYYYHCDNNTSAPGASKFELIGDTMVEIGRSSTGYGFGTRDFFISPDGTRLFMKGFMYDTALGGPAGNWMQELAGFGQNLWASTSNAWFAIGDSFVFDTRSLAAIHNLGINSSIKALSRDDRKLFQFDPATKSLVVTPMSTVLTPKISGHPSPQAVTVGGTVTMSGAAQGASPLVYQWLFNGVPIDGANNLNLTLLNVQAAQSGNYSLQVSNPYATATSDAATLTVLIPPSITRQPASLITPAGATATLSVEVSGTAPLSYQWQRDGADLPGATSAVLTMTNVQFTQAGTYQVLVQNSADIAISAPATLTVLSPPLLLQQPSSIALRVGSNALFSVTAVGTPALAYQWQFEEHDIARATNATLPLNNVLPAAAGDYRAVVRNDYGTATSDVATLTVLIPPAITQSPTNLTVPAGSTALFTAAATGTGPLRFQWQFEGANLTGATNNTFVLSNVQAAAAGAYRVTVTNILGGTGSSSAILRVLPAAPQFLQHPAHTTVDAGANATLNAVVIGSGPVTIQWYFADAPKPGANAISLVITNAQAGNAGHYFCVATNTYGSATSALARLTITPHAPVIVSQPLGRVILAGNTATLSVGIQGNEPLSFQWRQNGVPLAGLGAASLTISNAQTAHAGDYDVIVANALGSTTSVLATLTINVPARITQMPANRFAMLGDSITFNVSVEGTLPLSAQWQFNGTNLVGATSNTLMLPNVGFAQAGIYRVVVTNAFGNAAASITLSILPRAGIAVAWGDNLAGQSQAPVLNDVVRVSGGNFHSLALRADGTVTGWGDNSSGQAESPAGLSNVVAIAAGDGFSLALRANGTVLGWGDNSSGQTNVPVSATNIVAIAAGQAHGIALRASGSLIAWGNNAYNQAQAPQEREIIAIAAGEIHNLALRRNGTVVGWGNNAYNQATPPPGLSKVIAVSAGYLHSLALRVDGSVVAWGDGFFGQTSVPAGLLNVTAIAAGELHSSALLADGTLVTWGDDTYGQLHIPAATAGAIALASGYYHQLAIISLPRLQSAAVSSGLVLWWNGPCVLQQSTSPNGSFSDLATSNPWTNAWQSSSNSFYRLRRLP